MDRDEFNRQIVEEFRANEGKVGGRFEGAPILLLHHVGAKSGTERVNPLVYRADGTDWVIFASKAGAPTNPDWYHNLAANPATTIEVGTDTIDVIATEAEGAERSRIWEAQKADVQAFADYEKTTEGRQIPVIVLTRR
jgi:deazaflavin-dependent oxidoreductase (nitroreductase family)